MIEQGESWLVGGLFVGNTREFVLNVEQQDFVGIGFSLWIWKSLVVDDKMEKGMYEFYLNGMYVTFNEESYKTNSDNTLEISTR